MHFVVAGPIYARLAAAVTNMVKRGARTRNRLMGSRTPDILDGIILIAVRSAGSVRARMTGRAVCIEKYMGKVAC